MPARYLILSASVGAGHLRAAQAVELALRELDPEATIKNIDVLTLTNATFRRLYGKAYLDMVDVAPHVLGYLYDLSDRPRPLGNRQDKLRLMIEKLNLGKFCELLECDTWDLVINTHFLPAEIIAALRLDGTIHQPQLTVTTDFDTHRLWVNQPCELYTTATTVAAAYLHSWGVPKHMTRVTVIPIHPIFLKDVDRDAARSELGLPGDRPVVLQLAGGFGVGPIEKIYTGILQIERPLDVVVVAGRNEKAKAQLTAVDVPTRHRVKVIGFTDAIDRLMAAADVVVSKPGGLTSSELLARGAALAIINPIPGQEDRNSDWLLENGAAVKINSTATLAHKVEELLADPPRLARVQANAKALSRPRAAYEVAELAMKYRAVGAF